MSTTRKEGFYWVRRGLSWIIAEWDADMEWWRISGNEHIFYYNDFTEIDERRITREPKDGSLPGVVSIMD